MARRGLRYGCLLALSLFTLGGCGSMQPMGRGSELVKYRVNKGDTLYSISWRYGYDHREVAAWNKIKPPYQIYPGQQLLLITPHQKYPRGAKTPEPRPTAVATSGTRGEVKRPSPSATRPASTASTPIAKNNKRVETTPLRPQLKSIAWRWPSRGVITSGFNPAKGKKGLDIRGTLGQEVVAAADGDVVYSGSGLIGYGNLVIIKHNDTYLSAYGHNRRLLVREGAAVKQGEKIAEMGDSGKEGVILHFEIRRDGKPVNPLAYLPKSRY